MKPSVHHRGARIMLGGGIGAGKSLVAGLLAARGASVISADLIGHGVLEPDGPASAGVAARWPAVVVEGAIDRSRLADIVFRDPAELADLEAMTHPAIITRIVEEVETIDRSVVVEAPVMLALGEGWLRVFVDADEGLRMARAVTRGADRADVERRTTAQATRGRWLEWAEEVIVNDGTIDQLREQVNALWERVGPSSTLGLNG